MLESSTILHMRRVGLEEEIFLRLMLGWRRCRRLSNQRCSPFEDEETRKRRFRCPLQRELAGTRELRKWSSGL